MSRSYNRPMRPVEGVHVEWVDKEAVILHAETERLHYLNPTSALFYALIQESGFDVALAEMRSRFDEVDDLDEELSRITQEFLEEGLLEDD